jgi:hypothetical protein
MKTTTTCLSLILLIAVNQPAFSFDRNTLNATKACHDHVWFEVPEFSKLPNAAISAFPGSVDGETYVINWNVNWDDPRTRAAGNCTVMNEKVVAFEDYTKDQ